MRTLQWPFEGRWSELAEFRRLLSASQVFGLALVGTTGVGKTRLARECLEVAAAQGHRVLWLTAAEPTRSIPFGPFAHLLPAELPRSVDLLSLLRGAQETVLQLRDGGRLAIAMDDAHWLDPPSAALLHQLVTDGQVFLTVTIRDGETVPERVASLWTAGHVRRKELSALDRPTVDRLLAAALGAPVAAPTCQEMWRLSQGNPLLLRELVLGATESGQLEQVEGVWTHHRTLTPSGRVTDVVRARLDVLPPDQREALEVLAMAEPLGLGLLEAVVDEESVEQLERRGLVSIEQEKQRTSARLSHPLYGEVIRRSTPRSRRRHLAGRLADLLESTGAQRRADVLRLGVWRLESGSASDPAVLVRAARAADASFDHRLAERLAMAALPAGGFDAAFVAAQAIARQGRLEEADTLLRGLERDAEDDDALTRATVARAELRLFAGDPRVLGMLEEAVARVRSDSHREELEAMLVFAASYLGDLPRAVADGSRFLADPRSDSLATLRVLVIYTYVLPLMGRTNDLDHHLERGLDLARRHREAFPVAEHLLHVNRAYAASAVGRLLDAESLVRRWYTATIEDGAVDVHGLWANNVGYTLDLRGHLKEAARYLQEAVAALRKHDPVGMLPISLALAARVLAQLGHRDDAERLADEHDAQAARRALALGRAWRDRVRTWITALDGELASAAEQAARAGQQGLDEGLHIFAALTLHDAVRLGHPEPVRAMLADLAGQVDSALVKLLAGHAEALSASDADGLTSVAAGLQSMGADLQAAEAYAQAAHYHLRRGHRQEYRRDRRYSIELLRRSGGGGAHWLWLDRPDALTPREFEVALMASHGLGNRDIAGRLGISPRTVGNHLASTYAKLSVSGRHELSEVLDPDD